MLVYTVHRDCEHYVLRTHGHKSLDSRQRINALSELLTSQID